MAPDTTIEAAPLTYNGRIRMPYTWSAGETASRFFAELRDNARIWGTRCTTCGKVYVPPKKSCPHCLKPAHEWVEVSPRGSLVTYTVVHYREPALHPCEAPLAYGIVQLDGADTGLLHLLAEYEPGELTAGLRVEAVFREKRQGDLLDIQHFRPARRA